MGKLVTSYSKLLPRVFELIYKNTTTIFDETNLAEPITKLYKACRAQVEEQTPKIVNLLENVTVPYLERQLEKEKSNKELEAQKAIILYMLGDLVCISAKVAEKSKLVDLKKQAEGIYADADNVCGNVKQVMSWEHPRLTMLENCFLFDDDKYKSNES